MKSTFVHHFLLTLVMNCIIGCGPKPVAEDRPTADVNVTTETPETKTPNAEPVPDSTGVDVLVGGGQGVQVEVDREKQ